MSPLKDSIKLLISSALFLLCSSVNPVVPTIKLTPHAAVLLIVSADAGAIVKSTKTSAPEDFNVSSIDAFDITEGGFDVVLTNPPYGIKRKDKDMKTTEKIILLGKELPLGAKKLISKK